jgi:Calx-beta domain
MGRQRFGSGGSVRVFISLLVAGFAAILLPGPARAQTGTVVFGQSTFQASVSQSNVTIDVIFSGSTNAMATVDFSTGGGSAIAGVDYVAVSNTQTFVAENPTNTVVAITNLVNITLLNNGVAGSTQTVNLALSNPTGPAVLGSPSTAVLTIINNEMEQLQFAQASFSMDDTDSVAIITLVRVGATNGAVSVDFATSDGSARAGVDYMMTTGTVDFADGVLTNTVTIPIINPAPGALETNQTVNLTLSNPTGGASLGSPIHANLTIVATGPPVIQLTAATINVHEHVGHATVSAVRFNDSNVPVSVNYATSDGTASNGLDYLSTSGTLNFPVGVEQSSFSFFIEKFSTFQSNKTVNVTLSNPVSASLGTQTTAVVTIVNDEPQTIIFTNSGGGVVTLSLRIAGTMTPSNLEPLALVLDATDPGTVITVKVKKRRGGGTGLLQIDQITGNGSCKMIDATGFDVTGPGIALDGSLGQLRIHDLLNGAGIVANGSANQATSITAHNLDDGCAISLRSRLSRLSAARLGSLTTIDAPMIGTIALKGDKKNGIPGDCGATITIAGAGLETNTLALSKFTASGAISNASITVAGGSVGSVRASQMINSSLFVGYTPAVPNNPLVSGTFAGENHIREVAISGKANGFVNSDIAAASVGVVQLSSVVTDNGGLTFGITAGSRLSQVTVGTPRFKWMPKNGSDQSLGDFHVLH